MLMDNTTTSITTALLIQHSREVGFGNLHRPRHQGIDSELSDGMKSLVELASVLLIVRLLIVANQFIDLSEVNNKKKKFKDITSSSGLRYHQKGGRGGLGAHT